MFYTIAPIFDITKGLPRMGSIQSTVMSRQMLVRLEMDQ